MKLIIAGKRDISPSSVFLDQLINHYNIWIDQIVSGGAKGVDYSAKKYCKDTYGEDSEFKYKEFPADWDKHGKAAGPIRNREMANYADALLLIWDGESRGSKNMRNEMLKLNKPVYEVVLKTWNEPEEEM